MMPLMLARTVAQHVELDEQALGDADGVDLELLPPLARVRRALLQRDLRRELDHVAYLRERERRG